MKYAIRRNTILRDWHDGIDKYQSLYGRYPDYVEINRATLEDVMHYLYQNKLYGLEFRRDNEYVRDRYGMTIAVYRQERIFFEGIEICIRNGLEKEVMRIW